MAALAVACVAIMRMLRCGPFGVMQRSWQQRIEHARSPIPCRQPLTRAFSQFCAVNGLPPGTAHHSWCQEVLTPGLADAAQLLTELNAFGDHPQTVRRGLFCSGVMPGQAAQRMATAREGVLQAVAHELRHETLHSLRCPERSAEVAWGGERNRYAFWRACQRNPEARRTAVFPVMDALWNQTIRTRPLALPVTLNASEIDADLVERQWHDNRIKLLGTLVWHPRVTQVDNTLLRSVSHAQPHQAAISALASALRAQDVRRLLGPVLVVDALEKSPDVTSAQLHQAVLAFVTAALQVHGAPARLGTVVWNTLPAPWVYVPDRQELAREDWLDYERSCAAVQRSIVALSLAMRDALGPDLAVLMLQWERWV